MPGNPNPSLSTRFKKGQSGNPSGRSKSELIAHNKAAAIAAKLKLKALSCLQEKIDGDITCDEAIELLTNGDVLRMFKEVEDRAHGTPSQTTDVTSGGVKISMPTQISLVAASDNSDD